MAGSVLCRSILYPLIPQERCCLSGSTFLTCRRLPCCGVLPSCRLRCTSHGCGSWLRLEIPKFRIPAHRRPLLRGQVGYGHCRIHLRKSAVSPPCSGDEVMSFSAALI